MIERVALTLVLVFGVVISLLCVYGLAQPRKLLQSVLSTWQQPGGSLTAVLVRTLLGLNLIFASPLSAHPRAFVVLGAIALLAAIIMLLAGQQRLNRILLAVSRWPLAWLRLWLLVGLLFGVYLVWAAS